MSANVTAVAGAPAGRRSARSQLPGGVVGQLAAFAALALYAGSAYADLEIAAPKGRVLAVVALGTLGGGALTLTRAAGTSSRATVLRVALVLATGMLALGLAGVPARLLWPAGWGELGRWLSHGVNGLVGDLWPYRGSDPQVRLTVFLGLPAAVVPAAALAFWPGAQSARARRRTWALGLLMVLYVSALVNEPTGAWALHGLVLMVLLGAWFWLGRIAPGDGGRAAGWLTAGALGALVLASLARAPSPWLHYRSWDVFGAGAGAVSFQWNQLYGPIAWTRTNEPMFEVSAPQPQLWKVTTLDRFDGVGFLRSDTPPTAPLGRVQGGVADFQQIGITIRGLNSRLLPAGGQLQSVELAPSPVRRDVRVLSDSTGVLAGPVLQPGDTYTMIDYVAQPTPRQLRQAPTPGAPYRPYTQFELPPPGPARPVNLAAAARAGAGAALTIGPLPSWQAPLPNALRARLDASPYARMFSLARRLAAGQRNAYDVAVRIASFLRHNYTYDERPPARAYPLPAFLFQDGVGYCQQFSASMALMLRMDGIAARVGEGFLPGVYDTARHVYRVSAQDAHAWVEVYFPGIGWWNFDPTPPKRTASPRALAGPAGVSASLSALGLPPAPRLRRSPRPARDTVAHAGAVPATHRSDGGGMAPVGAVVLGLLGATLLAGAALLSVGTVRLARGARGEGEEAVAELSRALERLGYVTGGDVTLTRLGRRLESNHGPAAGAYVMRLVGRRYRPDAVAAPPSAAERRALRRALISQGGQWSRTLGLLALPPAISWPPRGRRAPRSGA